PPPVVSERWRCAALARQENELLLVQPEREVKCVENMCWTGCITPSRGNQVRAAQRWFRDHTYLLRYMVGPPPSSHVLGTTNPKSKRNRPARSPSTKVQAKKKARCRGKPEIA
ncbi:unnamed protein product, partial [Ectocarpus sp. 8 AP-2014]